MNDLDTVAARLFFRAFYDSFWSLFLKGKIRINAQEDDLIIRIPFILRFFDFAVGLCGDEGSWIKREDIRRILLSVSVAEPKKAKVGGRITTAVEISTKRVNEAAGVDFFGVFSGN